MSFPWKKRTCGNIFKEHVFRYISKLWVFGIINLKIIIKQIFTKKHTNSYKDLDLSVKCQRQKSQIC